MRNKIFPVLQKNRRTPPNRLTPVFLLLIAGVPHPGNEHGVAIFGSAGDLEHTASHFAGQRIGKTFQLKLAVSAQKIFDHAAVFRLKY